MNIVLLHDALGRDSSPDELDVFAQMDAIEAALRELGHGFSRLPFTLDLTAAADSLHRRRPDLVFNLVESIAGSGRLIHIAPSLLDTLGVPYTGCPSGAVYCTSNKVIAKRLLRGAGIPTPLSYSRPDLLRNIDIIPGRYILKSVWEHASRGLDDSSIVRAASARELLGALDRKLPDLAGEGFAERFIDGREFNLSLLTGNILPHAEILFEGYSGDRPRLVDYRAKWDEGSDEYRHTPRRFDFPHEDRPLLGALDTFAADSWRLFNLRGYARVDFRVDDKGQPWVLEINTNPCLSPDAGFAAAVSRAGHSFTDAVRQIITDSMP